MAATVNGQSLAALGIERASLELKTNAADAFNFYVAAAGCDGEAPFAFGDEIAVSLGGVTVFVGEVETCLPDRSVPSRGWEVAAFGPWRKLERMPFTTERMVWSVAAGEAVASRTSAVILGREPVTGNRLRTDEVIVEAISQAGLTAGTIDAGVFAPWAEVRDMMCSEVIANQLRWTPDRVAWFDYSSGSPVLHVRKAANLAAWEVAAGLGEMGFAPRTDLQAQGVVVQYEQIHEYTPPGGEPQLKTVFVEDKAPGSAAIGGDRVLVFTMSLQGSRVSAASAKISTEPLPADLNSKAWWKAKLPYLANIPDGDLTITSGARSGTMEYELTDGSIPDWLATQVDTEPDTLTALVSYTEKDANGNVLRTVREQRVSHSVMACDSDGGTFVNTEGESAEPVPSGLAAAVFESASALWWEGEARLAPVRDLQGRQWVGVRVNVSGGPAAWATMYAVAQTARVDLVARSVSVRCGPLSHVSPADLVEILRANRLRVSAEVSRSHDTGEAAAYGGAGAAPLMGGPEPRNNTVVGDSKPLPDGSADYECLVWDATGWSHTEASETIPTGFPGRWVQTFPRIHE